MNAHSAEKDAGPSYCLGYGPCLHALTAPCQSVGLPCERRTRAACSMCSGMGEIYDGPAVKWKPCPMCVTPPAEKGQADA